MNLGDRTEDSTIDFTFTTVTTTGAPTQLSGTPVISIYKANGTTQSTAGVTLTVDFDSVTGLNHVRIDTSSDAFYAVADDYSVVITTGTVGGTSVVGYTVATFSIENRFDGLVDAIWDEVLTGGTHNVVNSSGRRLRQIQEAGAYSGGAIYIDTVNGTAGTTNFENGVDSNPVDSIADANTIAASLGISTFIMASGSSITLAVTQANQTFKGCNWTLALGGQSIDGSVFSGATVSGIATNTSGTQYFLNCDMGVVTLPGDTHVIGSSIVSTQTIGESGDYFYDNCHSAVAGNGTPIIDINSVANVNVSWRHYSGGLQVNNAVSTTTMSYETDGQIVVDATCTSLVLTYRGNCSVTDNGTTTVITDDAAITRTAINAEVDTAISDANISTDIAAVKTDTAAILLDTGTDGVVISSAGFTDIWATTTMTEAYASDGSAATPAEMMYMIWARLSEFAISGTSYVSRKLDGSTTAMTHTLDDATTPTSSTRAS